MNSWFDVANRLKNENVSKKCFETPVLSLVSLKINETEKLADHMVNEEPKLYVLTHDYIGNVNSYDPYERQNK